MNKYFNYGRMKAIIANIKESINDLDNALNTYENLNDDNMKSIVGNSIRMSFVQIREEIFSAITSILKSSGMSVNSFNNNIEMIQKCREEGYFKDVDDAFFIILNKYRNSACHRYKQPSVDDIKVFYVTKKEMISTILEDLEQIVQ